MLIHPDWWTYRRSPKEGNEDIVQGKENLLFRRTDGKPLRVAVRGDCCSRRTVFMNASMFPDGVDVVINEKCPNVPFVDSLSGTSTVLTEELEELSATDSMPRTLRQYYLNQNQRTVLELSNLDLLIMDSYSDMNFELWELADRGCKFWVHPKFLREDSELRGRLKKIGRVTLDEAVRDAVAVIDHVRELNPGLPVLFLSQPVDFYPKLANRRQFDRLGERVAALRAGVYAPGPLQLEELEPDDLGSCGPGLTLHFTAATYRRMVKKAWEKGLKTHFDGSSDAREKIIAAPRPSVPPATRLESAHSLAQQSLIHINWLNDVLPVRLREIVRHARALGNPISVARWAFRRIVRRMFNVLRFLLPKTTGLLASNKVPSRTVEASVGGDSSQTKSAIGPPPTEPLNRVELSFCENSDTCVTSCQPAIEKAHKTYKEYFCFPPHEPEKEKRYTPMLIPFDQLVDFAAWESHIKSFGKGARLRQKNKAIRLGYVFHQFSWQQFIPDIHDINHSKEVRSGGEMRGSYKRSVQEMGGAPQCSIPVTAPACRHHWSMNFGVFLSEPGHRQGSVEVNERLVAYIVLHRTGEVLLYSMILGHGDHLANGVLVLLHHELVCWIGSQRTELTRDVRFLMYGGRENGGESLFQWKRQAGFAPWLVSAVDAR